MSYLYPGAFNISLNTSNDGADVNFEVNTSGVTSIIVPGEDFGFLSEVEDENVNAFVIPTSGLYFIHGSVSAITEGNGVSQAPPGTIMRAKYGLAHLDSEGSAIRVVSDTPAPWIIPEDWLEGTSTVDNIGAVTFNASIVVNANAGDIVVPFLMDLNPQNSDGTSYFSLGGFVGDYGSNFTSYNLLEGFKIN